MISGIYTISFTGISKYYIGYAHDFSSRWKDHLKELRGKRHKNIYLQNAFNKYEEQNIIFEILVECEEQFLCSEEHYWCMMLNTHDDRYGYNIRPTNPHQKCGGHSDETKRKISKGHIGKKVSIESRKRMSLSQKGRKQSKETIRKRFEKRKGVKRPPFSEKWIENMQNSKLLKKLDVYDLNKNIIYNNISIRELSIKLDTTMSAIRSAHRNNFICKKKYIIIESGEDIDIQYSKFIRHRSHTHLYKSVIIYNNNEEILFESISEAAKFLNLPPTSLHQSLKLGVKSRDYYVKRA